MGSSIAKWLFAFALSGYKAVWTSGWRWPPERGMGPQGHMPSSTFHGPYKQQKYEHRQFLYGDARRSWLISLHAHHLPSGGRHQLPHRLTPHAGAGASSSTSKPSVQRAACVQKKKKEDRLGTKSALKPRCALSRSGAGCLLAWLR
jgi:hypothetical protein